MTLAGTASLARNPGFADQVTAATVAAALQIQGETIDPDKPNLSLKRQRLARDILGNPTGHADSFAWAVAANPTISNATPDSPSLDNDIPYVITTIWDDLAGVTLQDTQSTPPVETPPA